MSKSKRQVEKYKEEIKYLQGIIKNHQATIGKIRRSIKKIEHPYLEEKHKE